MQPLVSIILPCYNSEPFLKYSLESVINQDYKNLEILCINDGSTDNTISMLREYQKDDNRIVIIDNEKNLGLIASLNKALTMVNGEYFARMDADDFSPPFRITKQLNFIQENDHLDLISSGCYSFKNDNEKTHYLPSVAKNPKAITFLSLFSNPCVHGSIFGKTSLIKSGKFVYDHGYPHAEDFELFSRLAWSNCQIASIDEPLYWLRINFGSVSFKYSDIQTDTNLKIVKRNLTEFLRVQNNIDDSILKILFNRIDLIVSIHEIKKAFELFSVFLNDSEKKMNFNKEEKSEIDKHLSLHKLNIIMQANKIRFAILGFKNAAFFLSSLLLINPSQHKLLFKKIFKGL